MKNNKEIIILFISIVCNVFLAMMNFIGPDFSTPKLNDSACSELEGWKTVVLAQSGSNSLLITADEEGRIIKKYKLNDRYYAMVYDQTQDVILLTSPSYVLSIGKDGMQKTSETIDDYPSTWYCETSCFNGTITVHSGIFIQKDKRLSGYENSLENAIYRPMLKAEQFDQMILSAAIAR